MDSFGRNDAFGFVVFAQKLAKPFLSFFLKLFIYFYFWLYWVFFCWEGFSLVVPRVGGYSSSWCPDFSLQWLLFLRSMGFRVSGFQQLQYMGSVIVVSGLQSTDRLNSYGTGAQVLHGIWDLPGSGIEPMSPALMGSLFITGKSKAFSYVLEVLLFFSGINSSFLSHFSLELKTFLFVPYQKKKKKKQRERL